MKFCVLGFLFWYTGRKKKKGGGLIKLYHHCWITGNEILWSVCFWIGVFNVICHLFYPSLPGNVKNIPNYFWFSDVKQDKSSYENQLNFSERILVAMIFSVIYWWQWYFQFTGNLKRVLNSYANFYHPSIEHLRKPPAHTKTFINNYYSVCISYYFTITYMK